jgi:malate/lactate dehydrogenase
MPREALSRKFTKRVKSVGHRIKPRKGSTSEAAAIAICTKTVLFPRKRTIKRFSVIKGKPRLVTQKRKM